MVGIGGSFNTDCATLFPMHCTCGLSSNTLIEQLNEEKTIEDNSVSENLETVDQQEVSTSIERRSNVLSTPAELFVAVEKRRENSRLNVDAFWNEKIKSFEQIASSRSHETKLAYERVAALEAELEREKSTTVV